MTTLTTKLNFATTAFLPLFLDFRALSYLTEFLFVFEIFETHSHKPANPGQEKKSSYSDVTPCHMVPVPYILQCFPSKMKYHNTKM